MENVHLTTVHENRPSRAGYGLGPVVEMRGGGGQGGYPHPKCARKCANFRNLKANVQILDRKTPPPKKKKLFTLFRLLVRTPLTEVKLPVQFGEGVFPRAKAAPPYD